MVFLQGDVDKDGFLNYGEFVAISVHLRKMGNDDHLKDAFALFDKNKSGYIEVEELREALSDEDEANNEEVISAIIQDVDTDKVSYSLPFSGHVSDAHVHLEAYSLYCFIIKTGKTKSLVSSASYKFYCYELMIIHVLVRTHNSAPGHPYLDLTFTFKMPSN